MYILTPGENIRIHYLSPAKRICVFEHSVMTNFNCACPAIQRGQGSGFLSEGSSWLTACMRRLAWTFAARIGDKYQIRLARPISGYRNYFMSNLKERYVVGLRLEPATPGLKGIANLTCYQMSCDKTNKMSVCPAKTQISLGYHLVWSESSLCVQWVGKDPSFLHKDREDSDQTGWMPRLIWVFAGRTCHFVGFVMRWFK